MVVWYLYGGPLILGNYQVVQQREDTQHFEAKYFPGCWGHDVGGAYWCLREGGGAAPSNNPRTFPMYSPITILAFAPH